MEFEPIAFLPELIPFIESSPFDITKLMVVPFSQQAVGESNNHANGIEYRGLSVPQITYNVNGDATINNQANFYLQIIRRIVDDQTNFELTNYISQFEQWVIAQSIMGKAPKFGMNSQYEMMTADGGSLIRIEERARTPFAVYQVFIRIRYQTEFESEDY